MAAGLTTPDLQILMGSNRFSLKRCPKFATIINRMRASGRTKIGIFKSILQIERCVTLPPADRWMRLSRPWQYFQPVRQITIALYIEHPPFEIYLHLGLVCEVCTGTKFSETKVMAVYLP